MSINYCKLSAEEKRGAIRVGFPDGGPLDELSYRLNVVRGVVEVIDPFESFVESGSKPYDLIETVFSRLYLISENALRVFQEEQLSGWKTFPIKIVSKSGTIIGYHGLSVTGKCGQLDESKVKRIMKSRVPGARPTEFAIGYYFEQSTWDGSDFFIPEGEIFILTSSRVKEVVQRHKLTNFEITPFSELERLPMDAFM